MRGDPLLLKAISTVIESLGIYHMNVKKVRSELNELKSSALEYSQLKIPSSSTVLRILKSTFHLKFGKADKANPKYRDPSFNEKRLWVSRLLAQFFLEDALIISVDESNFRSDYLASKQWSFDQSVIQKLERDNVKCKLAESKTRTQSAR